MKPGRQPIPHPPEGEHWSLVLATEEARFGGSRGWGRPEAEGILHLMEPGAMLLRP